MFTRVFEDNPPKLVFQNAEGHTVWKTMIGFIVEQMRIGYERKMPLVNGPKLSVNLTPISSSPYKLSTHSLQSNSEAYNYSPLSISQRRKKLRSSSAISTHSIIEKSKIIKQNRI